MALNYLDGGESVNHSGMNSLFGAFDNKMSTMLAGVDSHGVSEPGKSFILAFNETLAGNEGAYTSVELNRLMGKTFFFLSGPSVYSRIVPGFVDNGLGNAGESYDHTIFASGVAAATIIETDSNNHIVTIDKLGTDADGNIQTGTWWNDIGHDHNHYVSLFDYSLEAHTIDVSGTPHYIRERYTGSSVPQGTFDCVPEKKLEMGLAEIIVEGPTSVVIETAWNKYRCWRVHNLSQNPVTITIHGQPFTVPRWGCKTIRKLANGSFRSPYYYFVEFQAGDPLFYWFWRTTMSNPYATGSGAYANLDGNNTQPTACNSMYANNLSNPAVLHDWIDSLSRNKHGTRNACIIRDPTQICDSYDRYSDYYGDPSNGATIVGDLIHHKGKLIIARISATTANPDIPTLPSVTFEELEFNGYSTIVADFAAHQIAVSIDGSNHMVLTSTDTANAVTLISFTTNLLKQGEYIPDVVNLSTLDGFTLSFDAAPYNITSSPYTLEYAIFDGLVGGYQGYWDGFFPRCFSLTDQHPVIIKQRTIVTAANTAACGNGHKTNWTGAFNPASIYAAGDVVSCRGQYWFSISSTPAGNTPSYYAANGTDPNEYWAGIEGYASIWTAGSYKKGDLVQGVKPSPNSFDGMYVWRANSDTSDTPPPVGGPANGWNVPDGTDPGNQWNIGSSYEIIDTGNEQNQVPVAVFISYEEVFTGTETETIQTEAPSGNPTPSIQPHTHTVDDVLNLVTGSFFRDPTQSPDAIAVFDNASLTLTPSGLVLLFRERIPNVSNHAELTYDYFGSNNYGEAIIPPNTDGLGITTALQTEYQVSSDGLWMERWRRVNFRGHGWGIHQRIRLYSDLITTIDDAPIPAQHGTLFALPSYGRASCVYRVNFGSLPDGLDYELRPIFPSQTGVSLAERFDIIKNFINTDGRNWNLTHVRGDSLVSAHNNIRNEPGIKDRKNALINHLESTYFTVYYSTQSWIEQARKESAFIMAEHWNALAEAVNQCTKAIPLSWQCLKFYHDGSIVGLYDSEWDLMHNNPEAYPATEAQYRPMESFCGVNTDIGYSTFGDPNPMKSFYQSIGIAINSGLPAGMASIISQRTKYRTVNFNWSAEIESLSNQTLTLPADAGFHYLNEWASGTQLLSQCDYLLDMDASLGGEEIVPITGSDWLFDGPEIYNLYSGIEWVSISGVQNYAENLGFGFSHAEIIEPYEAVAFSIHDSISTGTFDDPSSGVTASWNGVIGVGPHDGIKDIKTPYQVKDETYGFTRTTIASIGSGVEIAGLEYTDADPGNPVYPVGRYCLINPSIDDSHDPEVRGMIVWRGGYYSMERWIVDPIDPPAFGIPRAFLDSGVGFWVPESYVRGASIDEIVASRVGFSSFTTVYDDSISDQEGTIPTWCSGVQDLEILSAGVVFSQHNLPQAPKWKRVLARLNAIGMVESEPERYWNVSIHEAYDRTNRGWISSGVRSGNENILSCQHPAIVQFGAGASATSEKSVYYNESEQLGGFIYGQGTVAFTGNAIPENYGTQIPTTYTPIERSGCFKSVKLGGSSEHFTTVALGEKKIVGVQIHASNGLSVNVGMNYIPKGFWAWSDGGFGIPDAYESEKQKYQRVQTQYKHADISGYQSGVVSLVFSDGGADNGGIGGRGYFGFSRNDFGYGHWNSMPDDTNMFDLEWVDPNWPGFQGTVAFIGGGTISTSGSPTGQVITSGVNVITLGLQPPSANYPHGSMYEVRVKLGGTVTI